jgi:hypothetical protein
MFPNDIYKSTDVIFVAEEITFSFCNPMAIHGQPLPTIPRLLLSEQTCLDKSRYPEFSDEWDPQLVGEAESVVETAGKGPRSAETCSELVVDALCTKA